MNLTFSVVRREEWQHEGRTLRAIWLQPTDTGPSLKVYVSEIEFNNIRQGDSGKFVWNPRPGTKAGLEAGTPPSIPGQP